MERDISVTGQKGVSKDFPTGGLRGPPKGNPLTRSSEATLAQMVHPPATPVGETHAITVSRHAESIFDTFKLPRDHHIPQPEQRHRSEANFTNLMLFGQGIWLRAQMQPSVASTPPTGVLLVRAPQPPVRDPFRAPFGPFLVCNAM